MGKIPQHIIDQILQDTDIVSVISEYVEVKKTGANFKACCPFHQEKTPSFVVSPQKQIYHCFGCGVGGNVIGFLMDYEKMEFPAAIEKLADRLGITIERTNNKVKDNRNDAFYKINAYAQWFFEQELKKSEKTLEYIKDRHLSPEIVQEYELGYAPDSFDSLIHYFQQKKVPEKMAAQVGLIKKGQREGYYGFYRDRLIFPIRNLRGHIVGFGGRALSDKSAAKYINSPESPIYNKSKELYGFYQAKQAIGQQDQTIIVEGYTDVLSCVQLGIKNTVAPLGTSLTLDQVKSIKRYTKNIILMFDGDEAGKKAALKGVETCLKAQIHPKVILLPDNKDPGDYLQDTDISENLAIMVPNAGYALDWLFSEYYKKITAKPSDRARLIRGMTHWIQSLADPVEKTEYHKKMSQYFELHPQNNEKIVENTNNSDTFYDLDFEGLTLEARLILLFIHQSGSDLDANINKISGEIEDNQLRQLAVHVENFLKKHETFHEALAIQTAPSELQGILSKILLKGHDTQLDSDMTECLHKLRLKQSKKRLKEITAAIVQAELLNDTSLKIKLLEEKQKILGTAKQGL